MVQLDDLGGLEQGSRQLGEPHHQDGAHREVRRDQAIAGVERTAKHLEIVVGEPGRADDRVDPVGRDSCEIHAGGLHDGEVDHDIGFGRTQIGDIFGHDELAAVETDDRVEVVAGPGAIDGGHQIEVGVGRHCVTDGLAHAAGRTDDTDIDHDRQSSCDPRRHS